MNDAQEQEIEEYKPIIIVHDLLELTLYIARKITTKIATVMMKMSFRLPAERNLSNQSRPTTFCYIFFKVSLH